MNELHIAITTQPEESKEKRSSQKIISGKQPGRAKYGLKAWISNPAGQLMFLIWYHPCDCSYLSTEEWQYSTPFQCQDGRDATFSESSVTRISAKISRICEFCIIMGIMTGLRGCCSSSTRGSRGNDTVKTLATLGFWRNLSPCSRATWFNFNPSVDK